MFLNDLFYLKLLGLVPISLKRRVWLVSQRWVCQVFIIVIILFHETIVNLPTLLHTST